MKTFFDESGSFAKASSWSVSVIGALTCRDFTLPQLKREFEELKRSWGLHGEPTGGRLQEEQVVQVVDLLLRHDAFFHVAVTDTSEVSESDITDLKQMHIDGLYRYLTPTHHPNLRKHVDECASFIGRFSFPSLIQFCILTHLLDRTLRDFLLWFASKAPHEIGSFGWILDAKDVTHTTKEESTWRYLVAAYLQCKSLVHPIIMVESLDYSHMESFMVAPPPHLIPFNQGIANLDSVIDVGKLVRDNVQFRISSDDIGLQLAHIVVNSYRRVLVGNIDAERVKSLGRLLMKSRKFAAEIVVPKPRWVPPTGLPSEMEARLLLLEGEATKRLRNR